MHDLVAALKAVSDRYKSAFPNFAVDGVPLEQLDVMMAVCHFLDEKMVTLILLPTSMTLKMINTR
jgi:hypothetical protein